MAQLSPRIHGFTRANPPEGVYTRDDLRTKTTIGCDVVIVGSGAGGATAAAELAEAGFDVIVLEEGGYHGTGDFTTRATEMIRRMYRDAGATAAIGLPPILYQEGRTVGGSSVVNGAMSWRTPDHILERWARDDRIDRMMPHDMAPYFDRVERRIQVAENDQDVIGTDNKLLKKGADIKGWDIVNNRRNQLHCAGSNNCAFGCPTGAKQSTLITYIPRALHFGARIFANVRVDKITRAGKRANGVVGHVVLANGKRGPKITVKAKLVIAACGSIHTPALLLRSGIKSPSGQLGRNLSMHPNIKVVATFDEEVRGWEGVHQAYQVREFKDEGIVTMAAVNIPPSVLALTLHHHGDALAELLSDYSRTVVAGLLCEDTSRGRIMMAPGGNPIPFYNIADFDLARIKRGTALLCELLFEAGAKRIILPFSGMDDLRSMDDVKKISETKIPRAAIEIVTVHLMGTARMGGLQSHAVTDSFGNVYDTEGVMVCDASLFPSPTGVNPAETIQVLATRNAAHVIENRRRYLS